MKLPALCSLLLSLPLVAQATSGPTHLLVDGETGPGGTTFSVVHLLNGTLSCGVPAMRSISTGFVLLGGFPAAIEAPATGRPWLTGALPRFATMRSQAAVALHGTELNIGTAPVLTIGGQPAPLLTRSNHKVTTTLPNQPAPGWQPVVASNSLGTTTLPRGIGVLPMLDFPNAPALGLASRLELRGKPGDALVLVAALGTIPAFPFRPFGHGLQVDIGTMVVLPPFVVTDPQGVLSIQTPANPGPARVFVQALVLTSDPGYAPGSFTNVVSF